MANEISLSITFNLANGSHTEKITTGTINVDQSAVGGSVPGVVSIGTSEEDVDLSELSTLGWLYMRNLDTTNYVSYGKKDGSNNMQAIGRMEAGEPCLFRLEPGATLRMQANTAACNVLIKAFEN